MNYNFLYTSDSTYYSHMYLSIYSLLKNNNYPLTIHIIETDFTKKQIEQLERLFILNKNATLKIYPFDKLKQIMEKYSIPKWRGTDIANARLFAHEIIDVSKILYIDSDTIVDKSLAELFDMKIENPVSAVKEIRIPERYKGTLSKYHNSGVLLFNYEKWEEYDCMKLLYDELKTTDKQLLLPDQDLLNIALNELIGILNLRYNMTPNVYNMSKYSLISKRFIEDHPNFYTMAELNEEAKNINIYHLLEYISVRPWAENSIHPFNEVYDKYIDPCFEKENVDGLLANIVTKCRLVPFLSILFQILFKDDEVTKKKILTCLRKSRGR